MRISEVAKRSGLSVSTIRYYEKTGLLPYVARGADGQRRFSATDADWLLLLASLKATGMALSSMRAFANLYAAGNATIPKRQVALLGHRKSLDERQLELDRCRTILDQKLRRYEEILEDKR